QAEELVAACRYRPQGRRGLAFGVAHHCYAGGPARVQMEAAHGANRTTALVEAAAGVDNAADGPAGGGRDLRRLGHCGLSGGRGGTLDHTIREKKIRIPPEATSPPFGILDRNNQPDGSEIATARQLATDLGVELELVQVTAPQRIPALLAGRADVAISSLSITMDRAKTVMFASPHGALSIVITAPRRVQARHASDMSGKKIGLTRATLEGASGP